MLSIIIPTLNEEKYLPLLLDSIKKQDFKDYEMIVADARSKDNTVKIAKSYGCKVVKGGLPPVARNNGAKSTKGDLLLFLDADVIIGKDFLRETVSEFYRRNLGAATCYYRPIKGKRVDKAIAFVANRWIQLNQYTNPNAAGFCIFSKKEIHEKIKGFNENLRLSEDHDYVKRVSKLSRFRVLKSRKINVSMRRFDKEGRLQLIKKYILILLHGWFKGEIKDNKIEYQFGDY